MHRRGGAFEEELGFLCKTWKPLLVKGGTQESKSHIFTVSRAKQLSVSLGGSAGSSVRRSKLTRRSLLHVSVTLNLKGAQQQAQEEKEAPVLGAEDGPADPSAEGMDWHLQPSCRGLAGTPLQHHGVANVTPSLVDAAQPSHPLAQTGSAVGSSLRGEHWE